MNIYLILGEKQFCYTFKSRSPITDKYSISEYFQNLFCSAIKRLSLPLTSSSSLWFHSSRPSPHWEELMKPTGVLTSGSDDKRRIHDCHFTLEACQRWSLYTSQSQSSINQSAGFSQSAFFGGGEIFGSLHPHEEFIFHLQKNKYYVFLLISPLEPNSLAVNAESDRFNKFAIYSNSTPL